MKNFTAKTARLCVKNGFTPEMVYEKYECTEEELKTRLSQVFKDEENARQVFSQLEANRKKPHGFHRTPKKKKQQIIDVIPYVDLPADSGEPEPAPSEEPTTKAGILKSMKMDEENRSQELMSLEVDFNVLLGKKRALNDGLRDLERNIEQISKQLTVYRDAYRQKADEVDRLVAEMNELSGIHREKATELAALRAKIEEMSTVIICVGNDGNIEAPDDDAVLNDEGYEPLVPEVFAYLQDKPEFDLRTSEIRSIARLLKMVERIERFNIIFDNESVEKVFWAVKGKEEPTI